MPISTALVKEIEHKRKKVVSNPHFILHRGKRIPYSQGTKDIDAWLDERPHMKSRLSRARSKEEYARLMKSIKEGVENLRKAWYYALGLPNVLTEQAVLNIGSKVDPVNNNGFYRREELALEHFSYTPPHPTRVRSSLITSLDSINTPQCSPIERAGMSHLFIVGIQPLSEGNKRTAGIVQDRILYQEHLPPVVIPANERAQYLALLEAGLSDWKDKKAKGQRAFCDYIGEKVNITLDQVITHMNAYSRHRAAK